MTAEDDMHRACADLRFAEGLRRRSAEARAEASVREACSLARLEGARVDPDVLRERVMGGFSVGSDAGFGDVRALQADLVIGMGAWRATWSVVSTLPELNRRAPSSSAPKPLRSLLAGMHRDYASLLVARGLCDTSEVAMPRDPNRWAEMLSRISGDGGSSSGGSAAERAATAWALFVMEEPFSVGNRVMGPLVAKRILAEQGVEPTAVSVISLLATEQAGQYRAALGEASAGRWEPWFDFFCRAVIRGCEVGQRVALRVQAGRLA